MGACSSGRRKAQRELASPWFRGRRCVQNVSELLGAVSRSREHRNDFAGG